MVAQELLPNYSENLHHTREQLEHGNFLVGQAGGMFARRTPCAPRQPAYARLAKALANPLDHQPRAKRLEHGEGLAFRRLITLCQGPGCYERAAKRAPQVSRILPAPRGFKRERVLRAKVGDRLRNVAAESAPRAQSRGEADPL